MQAETVKRLERDYKSLEDAKKNCEHLIGRKQQELDDLVKENKEIFF